MAGSMEVEHVEHFSPDSPEYQCCSYCCCRCFHVRTACVLLAIINFILAVLKICHICVTRTLWHVEDFENTSGDDQRNYVKIDAIFSIHILFMAVLPLAVLVFCCGIRFRATPLLMPYVIWHCLCATMVIVSMIVLFLSPYHSFYLIYWFPDYDLLTNRTSILDNELLPGNALAITNRITSITSSTVASYTSSTLQLPAGGLFYVQMALLCTLILVFLWNIWVIWLARIFYYYLKACLFHQQQSSLMTPFTTITAFDGSQMTISPYGANPKVLLNSKSTFDPMGSPIPYMDSASMYEASPKTTSRSDKPLLDD